jgi:hypothetical protein
MISSTRLSILAGVILITPGISPAVTPGSAQAAELHEFSKGKPARAAEVNENFDNLDQRLLKLESSQMSEQAIDCNSDANALLNTILQNNTSYTLSGMCNGPILIDNRRDITLKGDASGSKDDGVMLPAGLTEHPYGAVVVLKSSAIKLDNLTLSASNYVAQTYPFGENVASLSAGDQSWIDITNVDFTGGDYSVDVYNGAQLSLHQGVTVNGYNRAGLSAYNHALIRTHDDITVSGIVGASTESYPYAISAIANSIVEIRHGGSFSGASGQPIDEYATAVWSGDNSTIRFGNSDNPTTVNGSIESAYSSMVRIDGNLTLNGALAAYHRGYIRATGVTQSGGPIYAGDAATIRTEAASLTPVNMDYPATPIDVYRQGNLRMNNTTANLGGNALSVSSFAIINLRGSTDLGGADIFCHDPNQISLQGSVTGVGNVSCFGFQGP